MKKTVVNVILAAALLLSAANISFACTCAGTSSVCESYGDADAVFVGKVTGAKNKSKGKDEYENDVVFADSEIYFQVQEAFYGVEKNSRVTLFDDKTTCKFQFFIGETYLVYAFRENKNLSSALCTRTRPLSEAAQDLPELRQLAQEKSGTKIYGSVQLLGSAKFEPVSGHKLKLQSKGEIIREVETERNGNFVLANVPAGKYELLPVLPELMLFEDFTNFEIEVKGKGCRKESFNLFNDSLLSGKVLDSEGKPVKDAELELISTTYDYENPKEIFPFKTSSNEDGSFSFKRIGVGNYFLAVNLIEPPGKETPFSTRVYPTGANASQAAIINIGLGQKLDGIVFNLPNKLTEKTVTGRFKSDVALDFENIYLKDIEKGKLCYTCEVKKDRNGNFALQGFAGRQYRIEVAGRRQVRFKSAKGIELKEIEYYAESPIFVLNDDTQEFNLVLKKVEPQNKSLNPADKPKID